jgi:PAS domain-containing protein
MTTNAGRIPEAAPASSFDPINELILNSISEGIQWIDRDGLIVYENPAAVRLLGWQPRELIGQHAHRTMHHTRADGSAYPVTECHIYDGLHTG